MLDVDVRGLWSIGSGEFARWFTGATLIGTLVFVRYSTRITLIRSVVAPAAVTLISWLFVVVMPVSLVASIAMEAVLFHGRSNPASWVFAVLMSAIVGTVSSAAVLAASRQRLTRPVFAMLFGLNLVFVGLAVYRMVSYAIVHPPEA